MWNEGDILKVAMYGLAIVGIGILGIILFQLFGSITVTNQQDYVMLKNAVEAAMYDSVDDISYKKGFCICSDIGTTFETATDYKIEVLGDGVNSCPTGKYSYCKKLENEIKLNAPVFAESFVRRFSANIKGDRSYKILIHEIVEYPPKVRVEVLSAGNLNDFQKHEGTFTDADFNISNKVDSILEDRKG